MDRRNVALNTITEAMVGPMVAILFWVTMLLIVVLTFAHGKFFEANFFEAFGAIGQVGFAGAVFWLGWQQLEFTKQIASRQHKIDLFEYRLKYVEEYKEMRKRFYLKNFDSTVPFDFAELSLNIDNVFSRNTSAIAVALGGALFDLDEANDNLAEATDPIEVDRDRVTQLRSERSIINKRIRAKAVELIQAMRHDLQLELD
jgi:hypothetical protein